MAKRERSEPDDVVAVLHGIMAAPAANSAGQLAGVRQRILALSPDDPLWRPAACALLACEFALAGRNAASPADPTVESWLGADRETLLALAMTQDDVYHLVERMCVEMALARHDHDVVAIADAMVLHFPNQAEVWLLAALVYQRTGRPVFSLFERALKHTASMDWPERVMDEWLRLESVGGEYLKAAAMVAACAKPPPVAPTEPVPEPKKTKAESEPVPTRNRELYTAAVHPIAGTTTELHLREFFQQCGPIQAVVVSHEQAAARVEFTTERLLLAALTRTHKQLDGVAVEVVRAASTVWVNNFPATASRTDLVARFLEFGAVVDVRLPSLRHNANRRFCYVDFWRLQDAAQCVAALDNTAWGDHAVTVRLLAPTGPALSREVYVLSIPYEMTAEELRDMFLEAGTVEKLTLPASKKGNHPHGGYAFVVFSLALEAARALQWNQSIHHGRAISVAASNRRKGKDKKGRQAQPSSPATVAVANLPDTVRPAQLEAVFAEVGPVACVTLVPEHGGAFVEYAAVADAGKAPLVLLGRIVGESALEFVPVLRLFHTNSSLVPTQVKRRL